MTRKRFTHLTSYEYRKSLKVGDECIVYDYDQENEMMSDYPYRATVNKIEGGYIFAHNNKGGAFTFIRDKGDTGYRVLIARESDMSAKELAELVTLKLRQHT